MSQVIVIGGSAGALDALLALAPALPAELAVPVVLVLHLAPTQRSLVADVLQPTCSQEIREIEDKEALAPGTIHVAPPNYHVVVERAGTLALSVDEPVQFSRPSIDVLFESAAEAFGPGVVGVLLSGANDDGARGLQRIVECGGAAIIQHPDCALYRTMPAAARARIGDAARMVSVSLLATSIVSLAGRERS